MGKTSSATIDNQFLNGSRKPFWNVKRKLYDLRDCACGGTQDAGEVGAMYIGAVGRGDWCIYCKRCLTAEKAPTEAEAVEKWNNA